MNLEETNLADKRKKVKEKKGQAFSHAHIQEKEEVSWTSLYI